MNTDITKPVLVLVVPCYNEEKVLQASSSSSPAKLLQVIESLVMKGTISHFSIILFVDDGSTDDTWHIIETLHEKDKRYCGLKLSGNVGHQNALLAGLSHAMDKADITITIDADLQDDITIIENMVDLHGEGYDIVYGVRRGRNTDTLFKRLTALGFYKVMDMLGAKTIYNHADYRLMSQRAVKALLQYNERNVFLRGIVPLIGYPSICTYYDRSRRMAGESKYPINKMVKLALDGITSFSVKPMYIVLYIGITFIIISVIILIWVLFLWLKGLAIPGWSSLILSLWFCSGCILMAIGVLGEYVGKIYVEVKHRPRFHIEKTLP
ncbi:MAG: glycosyltransferase family 2 protein [Bacteroides sp.]|nr:glycosyltransferase family 2 protein [Bacteroides sp.]MCM1447310.1 glycosyltransferase family 2 protein [Bacteroides sp.]MCM1516845.1 glycosyltransferase family 2 protein [Paraprevotella sp.]